MPLASPHVHVLTVLDPVLTVLPMNAHLKNHIVVTRSSCSPVVTS